MLERINQLAAIKLNEDLERVRSRLDSSYMFNLLAESQESNQELKLNLVNVSLELVQLLTRKRVSNSLHMDLILAINEISITAINYQKEKKSIEFAHLLQSMESELKVVLDVMEFAEEKTKQISACNQRYIFKDEKELLIEYFRKELRHP